MSGSVVSAPKIIDLLLAAAESNRKHPLRSGQLLHLPGKGELIVAGDLHNHQRNFERIVEYAALDRHPQRYLVLQELIHGGPLGSRGEDTSFDMLVAALQLAAEFPGRVLFLMANHDLAQVQHVAVMKDGYDLTDRFNRGFELRYGKNASNVANAFYSYVYSQPLAAITVTGVFLSHSLPTARDLRPGPQTFDPTLLRRPLVAADYLRNGAVYQLIWGRNQTPDALAQLSKMWWADVFICGHQQQDKGFAVIPPNMLIVDSCHNHGMLLPLDLSRPYTMQDLTAALIPLAALE